MQVVWTLFLVVDIDVKGIFLCPCFSLLVVQIGLMMFVGVHDSFVVGQGQLF
jgi:hypothetical protein